MKRLNILILFAFGVLLTPGALVAQEGDIRQEEKSEVNQVIQKDSVPNSGASIQRSGENSDMLPIGPIPQVGLPKVPPVVESPDNSEKKLTIGNGEKVKPQEPQSDFTVNFIYYLFYKFKLVDSTDG